MNPLQPLVLDTIPKEARSPMVAALGPAVFTVTDTALIVSVGPSRIILTAEGIVLDAPRIDLNPEKTS